MLRVPRPARADASDGRAPDPDPRVAGADAAARIARRSGARGRARRRRRRTLGLMLRSAGGIIGLTILSSSRSIAVFGPLLAPQDPNSAAAFSSRHPGAAVVRRTCWAPTTTAATCSRSSSCGTRSRCWSGFAAALVSSVIGAVVGICAGYFGGWTDRILTAIDDWFLVMPFLPDRWSCSRPLLGDRAEAGRCGRVTRDDPRDRPPGLGRHVAHRPQRGAVGEGAARSSSARRRWARRNGWIMRRQILPNVLPLIFANTVLIVALSILTESTALVPRPRRPDAALVGADAGRRERRRRGGRSAPGGSSCRPASASRWS